MARDLHLARGPEQEDKEGDETDVSGVRARDVETESGSQEVQAI